jgi:hypothetical protein
MDSFSQPISEQLRAVALSLPETSEGTSCVNRAFKVRKKNFLFVGEKEKDAEVRVMLKLDASLEDAAALDDPRFTVGKTGWVTLRFGYNDVPDVELLSSWVIESFRTLGPKSVLKQLDNDEDLS